MQQSLGVTQTAKFKWGRTYQQFQNRGAQAKSEVRPPPHGHSLARGRDTGGISAARGTRGQQL